MKKSQKWAFLLYLLFVVIFVVNAFLISNKAPEIITDVIFGINMLLLIPMVALSVRTKRTVYDISINGNKEWLEKAEIHLVDEEFEEARECYDKAFVKISRYSRNLYEERIAIVAKLEKVTESLKTSTNKAQTYYDRALIYRDINYDKAISDLEMSIRIRYDNVKAHFMKGECNLIAKHYDEAAMDFTSVVKLRPESPDGYYWRGMAYYNSKIYGRSLEDFSKVIAMTPGDWDAYGERAKVYSAMERHDAANADVEMKKELVEKSQVTIFSPFSDHRDVLAS